MARIKRNVQYRFMGIIMILLLLMGAGFLVEKNWIDQVEEERSFEKLYQEAKELGREIETHIQADREQLEFLASMIAEYEDLESPEVGDLLESGITIGMMARMELLLPNDIVLRGDGSSVDAKGQLSFAEEAAQGEHISRRERDLSGGSSGYILRHFVPVIREGETIAMLYGVVDLGNLPDSLIIHPYDGQAAIYIIEGSNGDFLVDTWHQNEELGNIWEQGARTMAPGYDHEQLKRGLTEGEQDYVVFVSQTTGSYLYMYYMPLGINDWRIALSVPDSVVFEDANEIRSITNWVFMFEGACFLLVLLAGIGFFRAEGREKQRRWDIAQYIYDVGKILFDAHVKQENIQLALAKVGETTEADEVVLQVMGRNQRELTFLWQRAEKQREERLADWERSFPILLQHSKEKEDMTVYDSATLQKLLPWEKTWQNMIVVPIRDLEHRLYGLLLAGNVSNIREQRELLKSMGMNFGMLCRNMQSHALVRERGEKDALLGIYNRNRYEVDLQKYQELYHTSLACVYMDVNGLHDLNNHQGHEAGDRVLKQTAEELQSQYGSAYTYRIGGDEFIAFAIDEEEQSVRQKGEIVKKKLQDKGIYVSIGIAWTAQVSEMDALVKTAEKQMYAEKRKFYEYTRYQRGS